MTYGLRLAIVALAAFGATSLVATPIVLWAWRRVPPGSPATRADLFFGLRLLPTCGGLLAALVTMTSFVVYEPSVETERVGLTLIGLALLTAVALGWSLTMHVRQWRATRRLLVSWHRVGEFDATRRSAPPVPADVIECSFPIVALVGTVRPRLVVARQVLDACPPDEWDAVLAHETAHWRRRDNLRRALIQAAPDVLAQLPIGRQLTAAWHQATEEAADEHALTLGASGRVRLAQALIRVARLAPAIRVADDLPASALYRGENIDRRVRGLLAPPLPPVGAPTVVWRLGALALAALLLALTVGVVQIAIENAVEFLP